MRYLVIDTSGGTLAALVEVDTEKLELSEQSEQAFPQVKVLNRAYNQSSRGHAEAIVPLIAEVLGTANQPRDREELAAQSYQNSSVQEIAGVVVGSGPAPFTGLRAGIMAARLFAHVRQIPVYGLCTLDVLARQALDARLSDYSAVVLDARRKEIYGGLYKSNGLHDVTAVWEPNVLPATEFAQQLVDQGKANNLQLAGPALNLYSDVWGELPQLKEVEIPCPAVMVRMVLGRLAAQKAGKEVDLSVEPRYLRRPDVYAGVRSR